MFSKIVIDQYRPRESNIQQRLCWACEESIFSGSEKFQKKEFKATVFLPLGSKYCRYYTQVYGCLAWIKTQPGKYAQPCWGRGLLSLGSQQPGVMGRRRVSRERSTRCQWMPRKFWTLNIDTLPWTCTFFVFGGEEGGIMKPFLEQCLCVVKKQTS